MIMIVDTHTHLDMKEFETDREEVIKRAVDTSVTKMITVGVDLESSKKAVALSQKYPEVYAAVGIQPEEIDKYMDDELKLKSDFRRDLEELAANGKVIAIGEIGLDYKYIKEKSPYAKASGDLRQKQIEIFRRQLGLAVMLDLPVIVHCREAEEDIVSEMSRYKETKKLRGVIHCFTGTLEEAQQYIDLGFYIGINGIIFKFNIDEVIKKTSLDKILVETDCPYLTPPAEGKDKRNEPIFIKHVIQKIVDLKGISFQEVADKTTENARKLFKI